MSRPSAVRPRCRYIAAALGALGAVSALAVLPVAASAAITAPPGFQVSTFASSTTLSKPDDIVRLDGHLFVTWQNNAGRRWPARRLGQHRCRVLRLGRHAQPVDDHRACRGSDSSRAFGNA